jgi:voltage-gated potassium channel
VADERTRARRRRRRAWIRQGLVVGGLVVVFYAVPVTGLTLSGRTVLHILLTLLGVACLGWAIAGQVRRQLVAGSDANMQSLVMLLELVAVVFALGYYVLALSTPGEVAGLETRTDALYFTLSTLATVGYGDVHAVGQLARGLIIVQIVFDAVFVAAVVATLRVRVRARADG